MVVYLYRIFFLIFVVLYLYREYIKDIRFYREKLYSEI